MTGASGVPGTGPLRTAVAGAGLAELSWRATDGTPRASVVVPLWHQDTVWLAATYAERGLVADVLAAGEVVLTVTHLVTAAPSTPTLLLRAVAAEVPDPSGERFLEALLPQELRKHPPSRTLADSALLRRENWWFVPRLLLRLDPVATASTAAGTAAVEGLPAVRDPRTAAVLVTTPGPARPEVRVVERPPPGEPVEVPGARDAPALLLSHQASPDLERRGEHRTTGALRAGVLVPDEGQDAGVHDAPALAGPLSLTTRWRRQRALQRACVAGLRAARLH